MSRNESKCVEMSRNESKARKVQSDYQVYGMMINDRKASPTEPGILLQYLFVSRVSPEFAEGYYGSVLPLAIVMAIPNAARN